MPDSCLFPGPFSVTNLSRIPDMMTTRAPDDMELGLPYEIASLRPINTTTRAQRMQILENAGYNTELIPQHAVYVDLKTDSGVGSRSTLQIAEKLDISLLEPAPELAPEAHGSLQRLSVRFNELFGLPFILACSQGRAAERIWCKMHVKGESIVPANMLFPSTRYHIGSNGGKVVELPCPEAYELTSDYPFKGNMDIDGLVRLLDEAAPDQIPFACLELCNNACGGHPVSLEHLERVKQILEPHGIPLLLDASRILENSYLLQQREPSCRHDSIPEIVRKTCATANAITLSAQKDFGVQAGGLIGTRDDGTYQQAALQAFLDGVQPESSTMRAVEAAMAEHLRTDAYIRARVTQVAYLWQLLAESGVPVLHPAGGHAVYADVERFLPHMSEQQNPAEALAAFLYLSSGVRISKGPPPTQGQKERGATLIRMAIPAHRYLNAHLDHVAKALTQAFKDRQQIPGLSKVTAPQRGQYAPPWFTRAPK
jgi:tyrosine phenol-lyase